MPQHIINKGVNPTNVKSEEKEWWTDMVIHMVNPKFKEEVQLIFWTRQGTKKSTDNKMSVCSGEIFFVMYFETDVDLFEFGNLSVLLLLKLQA